MADVLDDNAPAPPPGSAAGLLARLQAFEGAPVGPPTTAPDPVNQPMIRHWVEAMGDENPVYVDESAARAEGFPTVVAPPTMLQAWIMRGYRATTEMQAARSETSPKRAATSSAPGAPPRAGAGASAGTVTSTAQDELFSLLDGAGFTSVVATNCEQEYHRPLVLGDHLTVSSVIESVSPEKQTALGAGHFVTTRSEFTDQHGEHVASMRFRILRFRPRTTAPAPATSGQPPPAARPQRPRPAVTADTAFFFEGARQGRLLVQRCASCGALRHPPSPGCSRCRSLAWDTLEASGRGTVYSFVVVHHPQVPAFDYPLPVAVVQLEEGTRLVADLVGLAPDDVHIGMAVRAEFVAVDDELTLPMFRPASAEA